MKNMKRSISSIFAISAAVVLTISSCTGRSFNISGAITEAKDSVLYLENMSLSGPVAIDSVKLSESGTFSFSHQAPAAPEFYRLRIAGQIINIAVDSTEQIEVKAQSLEGDARVKYLTDYSCQKGDEMIARWQQLAFYLIVKYNDIVVKPTDEQGRFERNKFGGGAKVKRPGMPETYARELIRRTGDKFLVPEKEKKD